MDFFDSAIKVFSPDRQSNGSQADIISEKCPISSNRMDELSWLSYSVSADPNSNYQQLSHSNNSNISNISNDSNICQRRPSLFEESLLDNSFDLLANFKKDIKRCNTVIENNITYKQKCDTLALNKSVTEEKELNFIYYHYYKNCMLKKLTRKENYAYLKQDLHPKPAACFICNNELAEKSQVKKLKCCKFNVHESCLKKT